MNTYSLLQKNISISILIALLLAFTPISGLNAAATLTGTIEVSTPSNNQTPSYTFESDSSGSIAYGGPCTSITTLASTGSNTITFDSLIEGTYSICTVVVDDGSGPSNLLTLATFIIDITLPLVSLVGSGTETVLSGSLYSDAGATWSDNVDGTGTILTATSGSVNTAATGTYTLEYTQVDVAGNTGATVTRTVNVVEPDLTAPVVVLVGGAQTVAHGGIYSDLGATYTDNVDAPGTIAAYNSGSLNMNVVGVYTIGYTKVDVAGNTGTITRTVTVTDQTAPVVSLVGSGTETVLSGSLYSDAGATWSDNVDGTGTILTATSGSVNTAATGTYTLEYTQVDVAGNTGATVTRTVNVVEPDLTAPVVVLVGGAQTVAHGGIYSDLGATYTDNVDAPGTIAAYNSGSLNMNVVGVYTIGYTKVDVAGNTGTITRTVTVTDQTAPVVSLVGSGTETVLSGSLYSDAGATWSDNVDGTGTILTATSGSVNTAATGTYTLEYTQVDVAGNTGATVTRTVNVVEPDLTAPVVVLVGGAQTVAHGGIYSDLGATYTDNVDAPGTIAAYNSGSLNMNVVGVYTIGYTKVDVAGNTGTITRTVTVTDQTAPVVSLVGSGTETVLSGSLYSDAGATWSDNVDGTGTILTATSGSVNTAATGTYTLEYTQVDVAGNTGATVTRTVNVVEPDLTAPVVVLVGGAQTVAHGGIYSDLGATYTDNVDAPGTIAAYNSGSLNMNVVGVYTIGYTKVDVAGNTGTITRTVTVTDQTAPVVSLVGSGTETVLSGSLYSDAGATWSDNVDGTGTILTATSGSVNTAATGTYTLEYTQVDVAGNTGATVTRTVNVVEPDLTAPVVVLVGGAQTVAHGGIYSDLGATYTDNVDAPGTIAAYNSGSLNMNVVGVYTIGYTKVDVAGNTGTITRTVTVTDQTAPVVSLVGSGTETVLSGSLYSDAGATWSDNVDGTGTILTATSGSVNTAATGTYTLEYTQVDVAGNTGATVTRTVNVVEPDLTAPVVVLVGGAQTVAHGGIYSDLGATYTDNVDAPGTIAAYNSGSLNMNVVGVYTIGYTKVDVAGNTGTITRTVTVTDQTAPVVSLVGSGTETVLSGSLYSDAGATWSDNVDGTGTILTATSGSVNTAATGTYTLEYTQVDVAGNTGATVTRTVNVISGIMLTNTSSGTNSIAVLTGSVNLNVLIVTNGYSITTTSLDGVLNIPGSVNFLISGSVWDGIVYAPTVSTGSTLDFGDVGVLTNLPVDTPSTDYTHTILSTFMAGGTGNTSLIANGGVFNVTIQINSPSVNSGSMVTILRSNNASNWVPSTPMPTCILDMNRMCTYTTDHLSYFGFVSVMSSPIIPNVPSGALSGGGGGASYGPNVSSFVGFNSAPNTEINNLLVPSIMRLLEQSMNNTTSIITTPNNPKHQVINPITSYICPIIERVSNFSDVSSVSEGEFTSDVQSILMYRGLDNNEDSLSMEYIEDKSSGIASNNGNFQGNRPVTRAEFIKMLVRSLSCHYEFMGNDVGFSDVDPDMWYSEYIAFATENGWIKGYSDGTFQPNKSITRAEAAKILTQAIQLETYTDNVISFFDIDNSNEFAPYIYALRKYTIIGGKTPNFFDMESNISRNEVARIINKTFLTMENK